MWFAVFRFLELAGGWSTHGPLDVRPSQVAVAAGPNRRVFTVASNALENIYDIYRSEDGGFSWERVTDAPVREFFTTVACDPRDPDRVFAATVFFDIVRLYRSLDGGTTWTLRQTILLAENCRIEFDAVEPDTVYFYVSHWAASRMYRTVDGGESFASFPTPFFRAFLASVPDGTLLAAAADGSDGIYASRDRGETWSLAAHPRIECPVTAFVVDPVDFDRWFLGTGYDAIPCGEVIRTDDGGVTWVTMPDIYGPITDLVMDRKRPGVLYAGTDDTLPSDRYHHGTLGSVWSTRDGGATWIDLRLPVLSGATSLALPDDGNRIFAATGLGVYVSDPRLPRALPHR
jgi:photosystem II stability/assembly factor-like uncharacterized protein